MWRLTNCNLLFIDMCLELFRRFISFPSCCRIGGIGIDIETCIELWNLPGSFCTHSRLILCYLVRLRRISLLTLPDVAAEFDRLHMSWRWAVTLSLRVTWVQFDVLRFSRLSQEVMQVQLLRELRTGTLLKADRSMVPTIPPATATKRALAIPLSH